MRPIQPPLPSTDFATYQGEGALGPGTIRATVQGQEYAAVAIAGGAKPAEGDQGAVVYLDRASRRNPVWVAASGKRQQRTRSRQTPARAGWWTQWEGNVARGWLAPSRPVEMWQPVQLGYDNWEEILNLRTHGREEDEAPYLAFWGGLVSYRESEGGNMLVAGVAVRIESTTDFEPYEYDDASRAKLVLFQFDRGTLAYEREVPLAIEIGGTMRPIHLHHDPTKRMLIARGSLSGAETRRLYVWRQSDGHFLGRSELPWNLYQTVIMGDLAIKVWWTGDESGQTDPPNPDSTQDILIRAARRAANGLYFPSWTINPKTLLGLPIQTDPPSWQGGPEDRDKANYQESVIVSNGPSDVLDVLPRAPYHLGTDSLALAIAGHVGLDWGFPGYPSLTSFGPISNPQDRAVAFDWQIDPVSAPHFELGLTREVKARLCVLNPRTGAELWGWERVITAEENPTVDEDTLPAGTPDPDPSFGASITRNDRGWANHGQLTGEFSGDNTSPGQPFNSEAPWNPYAAVVPDYRYFKAHLEGDQLGITPNGPLAFNAAGDAVFAWDEPYQIAVGPGTPGGSVTFGTSPYAGGGSIFSVTHVTLDPAPPHSATAITYDYWGVYSIETWKRTILRRVRTTGAGHGEVVWEVDLTIMSEGYTVGGTLISSMGRPIKHRIKQIVCVEADGIAARVLVLREWSDPATNKPLTTVLEEYLDEDGTLIRRVQLGRSEQNVNALTTVCLDNPLFVEGAPHVPPGEPPCESFIILDPYAWLYRLTVLEPIKGGVGSYFNDSLGRIWLAIRTELEVYATDDEDHIAGSTYQRLTVLEWRADLFEDDAERFVANTYEGAMPLEEEASLQSLLFFEGDPTKGGSAYWSDGAILRATLDTTPAP